MYHAEVLLDSLAPSGTRLTTLRVTMPRFILAEFNTHRAFSRNAGSSRAIPIGRRIKQVRENPVIPIAFGANQGRMQAGPEIAAADKARDIWISAAQSACAFAESLNDVGLHKQWANRVLEPYSWVQVIVSSTQWENFFQLRDSELAQPEMGKTAKVMRDALDTSVPFQCKWGDWHIPCIDVVDRSVDNPIDLIYISAGRLARVSYEAEAKEPQDEIALARKLKKDGHWSPFEHIAKCVPGRADRCRNFVKDWDQFRAMVDTKE